MVDVAKVLDSRLDKGKVHPRTGHEAREGEKNYSSTLSLTLALDGGWWSTPRPGRFTPRKDPVPIVQGARWAPGPVWTSAENLSPISILSPDRPARSDGPLAARVQETNGNYMS
jgi:hypothetical protein